jgi:DNA ligase (NAD+)
MMEAMGFDIPWYSKMNITMTEKSLESMLKMRKERSLYDIDGIIITHDGLYSANVAGNPKQSKAFKMVLEEQMEETVVEKVEWNISKDGYLKPTIHIQQVTIGGVNIKRTSGFNARYIKEHGIGAGTRIILVRSGDVIPHIYSVLAPVKPDMPEIECVWSGTDLVVIGEDLGKDHTLKNLQYFMHKLDIPKIGGGTLSKLYDAGYENITLLLHATEEELHSKDIPGLGSKKISDIVNGLSEGVTARPLSKLMAASNIFGRGIAETRIQLILDVIPNILEREADEDLKLEIEGIDKFQEQTAAAFMDHLDEFREFLKQHPMITFEVPIASPEPGGDLAAPQSDMFGKRVLCTGGKPENYDELLKKHGAVNVKSVSKKLDILVVSTILDDMSQASGKYKKAAILNLEKVANIDIIDHDTFQKYFL